MACRRGASSTPSARKDLSIRTVLSKPADSSFPPGCSPSAAGEVLAAVRGCVMDWVDLGRRSMIAGVKTHAKQGRR